MDEKGKGKVGLDRQDKRWKREKVKDYIFFKERIYRQAEKDGVEKVIGGNDRK